MSSDEKIDEVDQDDIVYYSGHFDDGEQRHSFTIEEYGTSMSSSKPVYFISETPSQYAKEQYEKVKNDPRYVFVQPTPIYKGTFVTGEDQDLYLFTIFKDGIINLKKYDFDDKKMKIVFFVHEDSVNQKKATRALDNLKETFREVTLCPVA